MNFTSQIRYNPETGQDEKYYRLKESYRDASGRPCTRILLNVGFIHGLSPVEIRDVARGLTYKYDNQDKRELWDDKLCCYSDVVRRKIDEYWKMLEEEDRLDLIHDAIEASREKASRRVDVDTLEHREARDIGAEWLCLQALRQVGFDRFLRSLGWSGDMVKLAVAHLIVRTVYTPSELGSIRIMQRNSAVCWLVDLALCINTEGFIRYSSILEGNTADPKSLPDMVDKLIAENPADAPADQKVLVVMDAGISTKKNLGLIKQKGYDRSDAHLFLGLLAYWGVNIIRHQLKKENEKRKEADPDPKAEYPTPYWSEIVDIMKTQKVVKSEAVNTLGEKVDMLICSTPTEEAAEIYSVLNYKPIPFRKIKIRRTQQT